MPPPSTSSEEEQSKHYYILRNLALIATLSAALSVHIFSGFYARDARLTSKLSGPEYVAELRNGHPEIFKSAIGMQKHVFDKLLDVLERRGGLENSKYMRTDEKLAIFLSMATTGMTNREAQNRFQRSADTISKTIHKIINILVSPVIYNVYVRLPRDTDDTPPEIEDNKKLYPYLRDCLGALDCTHIHAHVLAEDRPRYRNRKGFISQNVLAVVSFDMRFMYVLSGWEGSAADSTILDDARKCDFLIPRNKFYLGDAGFSASTSVLVPYRGVRYHLREWHAGNQNSRPQNAKELFNLRHAQARNVVERIFGVFKRRFSIINAAPEYPIETQAALIQALCVVHNIIRIYDPHDIPRLDDLVDEMESEEPGERAAGGGQAEKNQAEVMRDRIAEDMWKNYVLERQRRVNKSK
ncbi:hypothetical protein ACEPAI_8992 [Sanghuangporus weigelae]